MAVNENKNKDENKSSKDMWLSAAGEIRSQISQLKNRIAKKKAALSFFEEAAENGYEWPGKDVQP